MYSIQTMRKVEQQLIQGILSKDKGAFDMLFRSYYSTLVFVASDMLNNRQLAEEAVQDVFVKLWRSGANLSIDVSLGSYLTRMVRNRSIDYLRANERQIKTVSIENREIQIKLHDLGMDASVEEDLFSENLENAIEQAIEQLPAQCRQIFVLNRFDGFSHKEIAGQLNISVSTVKTQITRALQKLKEKLNFL
jgi:RNA polymerase sigma-70 factor (ECF subfamily)